MEKYIMPLTSCGTGKYKWGNNGKCYDNKKDAIKQGIAIEGPDKFKKIMTSEGSKAFGGTDGLLVAKSAYDEFVKEERIASANAFKSIASFLSTKADDGQMSSSTNRGGMLDNPKDKGDETDDCIASEVDNAGDLSGNPSKTGDGSGNEFTSPKRKKGSASLKEDDYAKDDDDDQDGDEPDPEAKASVEIKDPNRGPVGKDDYKDGDELKVHPCTVGSQKDGKPTTTVVEDGDDDDNNQNGLDKSNEQLAGNVVKPPYNKSASPETKPGYKNNYTPPSRTETTPPNNDNRTTLDPKLQYKVKSDKDVNFGMDEENGPNDKPKAKGGSISEVKEKEDIVTKTSKGEDEDYESSEAVWKSIAYISQEERDKVANEDFAGPHRSFPIRNGKDVKNAAHLVGHADDPSAVKRRIIEIAHRKGLEGHLPESWKSPDRQKSAAYEQALALFSKLSIGERNKLKADMEFQENAVNKPSPTIPEDEQVS